jgi:glycosyltransferase involved in cell wall biosynthesis
MPIMGVVDLVIPAYNGGATIEACLDSVSKQGMPEGWALQVTVVDDASTDDTGRLAADYRQLEVWVLTNGQNLGRARTRNVGAAHGRGETVVFLDCDCELENPGVLARFIERLEEGSDCVFANVIATGDDFAARFTNDTARKRFAAAQTGDFMAMTSACFAVRRSVLEEVGGFCEEYTHYGFEDRDFIAMLKRKGARLAVDEVCLVRHSEEFIVPEVARKFFESAKFSAPIFFRHFPLLYESSRYGKIDPRVTPRAIKRLMIPLIVFLPVARRTTAWALRKRFLPYALKKTLLKSLSFLAYLKGCSQSAMG